MRALTIAALAASLLLLAPGAHALEFVKGDGYRVQIPDGYVAMDLPGGLLSSAQAQIAGHLPTTGTPELRVYVRGSEVDPESVIVLSRIGLKMGAWNKDALEEIRADARDYRGQLGNGVEIDLQSRQVAGRLDALEVSYDFAESELSSQIGQMRYLVTSNGGFLLVLMMMAGPNTDDTVVDRHWTTLTGSLHVTSTTTPTSKLLLWGGLGLAGMILLLLLYRAFDHAAAADGRQGAAMAPPTAAGVTRAMDGLGTYAGGGPPSQAAPPGLRSTGPAPRQAPGPGLRPTGPGSPPPPAPRAPAPPGEAPQRSGLKSTLPPSGRWNQ